MSSYNGKTLFRVTMYRKRDSYRCIIHDYEDGMHAMAEDENPMHAFGKADMELERQGGGLGGIIVNGDGANWED